MIKEEKFIETYQIFDKETVVEIIDLFIEEYDMRIEKLSLHLNSCNFVEMQKCTHAFKGVIANFETECKAYEEITEIDAECRHLSEKGAAISDDENNKLSEKLKPIFVSFKRNSKQMLNQLKEMRKLYQD